MKIFYYIFLIMAVGLNAQTKLSELTRSNSSFKKTYQNTDVFEDSNKRFEDGDKRFETSTFRDSDKKFIDRDKKFDTFKFYDSDKKYIDGDKKFNSPNLESMSVDSRWRDSSKKLNLENKDRDLNRVYEGKIDMEQRHKLSNFMRSNYDNLVDRSLSDINKYYSHSTRGVEGGVPVSVAGKEAEEESILDLFDFSNKKISNSNIGFKMPEDLSDMRMPTDSNSGRKTYHRAETSSGEYKKSTNTNTSSNYTKRTYSHQVEPEKKSNATSAFGIPAEYNTGKINVTVEVKKKE